MSAYTTRPPGQILTIAPPAVQVTEAVHTELDAFMFVSQQVETALVQGRANCRKLKEELGTLQRRHEDTSRASELKAHELKLMVSALQETEKNLRARGENLERSLNQGKASFEALRNGARQKLEAFSKREDQFKAALLADRARFETERAARKASEERLTFQLAQASEALKRISTELNLYKSSWAKVMEMDRDAAVHLKERPELLNRIQKLESLNLTLAAESKERIRAIEVETETLRQQQAQAEQNLKKSESELRQLQEKLAEAETSAHVYEERATSLEARAIVLEGRLSSQKEDTLQKKLDAVTAERNAMKKELEEAILTLREAKSQSESLRRNYPLRELLTHKENELMRATQEIKKLKPGHPTRPQAEQILAALQEQRDQLRKILREAEAK